MMPMTACAKRNVKRIYPAQVLQQIMKLGETNRLFKFYYKNIYWHDNIGSRKNELGKKHGR